MDMCEYKEKIEEEIIEHYSDIESIDTCDLHELGEWIDICKDIAEMKMYEAKTNKENHIIEAMEHSDIEGRSVDSIIQSLSNMIEESIKDMTSEQITKYKTKLQLIIDKM